MKQPFNKIVLLFLIIAVGTAHTQSSQNFANNIQGTWEGSGTLFQQKASFNMKWENALNDKFIKLNFKNSFKDRSGAERVMKASAYYNFKQKKGYWFDTRGMMLPLKLEINENSMIVLWGDKLTEQGKTIYSINENRQLNVQDFVFKDDSYFLFGEATYKKVNK